MKITIIGCTHGSHEKLTTSLKNGGDVLIHTGDFTNRGCIDEILKFKVWINQQPFKYKIVIAGNHDLSFQYNSSLARATLLEGNNNDIIYLEDNYTEIEGVKFYGHPWTPRFFNWAFMYDDKNKIEHILDLFPKDIDVLITHGPPKRILDRVMCRNTGKQSSVGCKYLLEKILQIKPRIVCFSHIHEGYGVVETRGIKFINASSFSPVDTSYFGRKNIPVTVEI